jgi:hypothetical protein
VSEASWSKCTSSRYYLVQLNGFLTMNFKLLRQVFIVFMLPAASAMPPPTAVLNQDVSQATLSETICTPGYTRSVRPSSSYTNGIKKRLMRVDGLDFDTDKSQFELDHVVPLALGGHPRNINNLVLQKWEGSNGAKRKDRLEVKLQCLVCARRVTLAEVQDAIWTDWEAAYHHYGRMVCKRPRGLKSQDYGD